MVAVTLKRGESGSVAVNVMVNNVSSRPDAVAGWATGGRSALVTLMVMYALSELR